MAPRYKPFVPTPPPWSAQPGTEWEGFREWWVYADKAKPGSKLVAICPTADAESNARLIECAPGLLDAVLHALAEATLADGVATISKPAFDAMLAAVERLR